MEADLERDGNQCPNCLNSLVSIAPQALFYTCGCVVCQECQEEMQECPLHKKDLYRCRDPTVQTQLIEINRLYEQYEKEYHTSDRPELDGLVLQLRLYVKGKGTPQPVQPAYQPLPEFPKVCPNCHIPMTALRCNCGFVDLSIVPTYVQTLREEASYVPCRRCGQTTTPKGQPNCYNCGKSLDGGDSSQSSQVWACRCGYEYNMEASCIQCHVPKTETPPKPVVPLKPEGSTLVWTCTHCGYEYNLNATSNCLKCKKNKFDRPQAGWQCPCGTFNPVNEYYCSYCRNPKPTPQIPHPAPPIPHPDPSHWTCQKCKRDNQNLAKICYNCRSQKVVLNPPRAGYQPSRPK